MKSIKLCVIICCCCFAPLLSQAQQSGEKEPVFPKGSLSVNLGMSTFYTKGALGEAETSVAIERRVYSYKGMRLHAMGQIGLFMKPLVAGGTNYRLGMNVVTGTGKNHFEAQSGLAVYHATYVPFGGNPDGQKTEIDEYKFYPHLNVGYRYQRPGTSGIVFKVLVGTFNHISLGYAF